MRFVSPETVRIDLANGDWIEVKKELTVGEEKRYRSAGMKRVKATSDQQTGSDRSTDVEIDWTALAMARVHAYLVDWSATKMDDKGKVTPVPVTVKTIENLDRQDFDLIDKAIEAHIGAQDAEKNSPGSAANSTSMS